MNSTVKTVVFWLVIVLSGVLLWQVVKAAVRSKDKEISFSAFLADVNRGAVKEVDITGTEVRGHDNDGKVGSIRRFPRTTRTCIRRSGQERQYQDS